MDTERLVQSAAAVVDMVADWAGDDDVVVARPSQTWSSVAGRELCMPFRARWRPRLLVPITAAMAASACRPAAASPCPRCRGHGDLASQPAAVSSRSLPPRPWQTPHPGRQLRLLVPTAAAMAGFSSPAAASPHHRPFRSGGVHGGCPGLPARRVEAGGVRSASRMEFMAKSTGAVKNGIQL
jgi:hypothetical protein